MSKVRRQTEKKTAAESGASAALNPALVALLEQHRTAIAADVKPTS